VVVGTQTAKLYRCGDVEIIPARGVLQVRGVELHLRAKSLEMLEYLIANRNRLVAKSELLDELWKGTNVNDNAPAQCVIELRKALGDNSRNPRFIKTVSKLGYQFIGPVEETMEPDATTIEFQNVVTTNIEIEEGVPRHWLVACGVVVALAALILLWRAGEARPETALRPIDGKHPVVVMYFENQSKSPELDWLREGLADMLISNLSHLPKLSVLSRQQLALSLSRSPQPGPPDLGQALEIGRNARADRVILGSFVKIGSQVRVLSQIVNASGQTVASESVTAAGLDQILPQIDTLALELAADLGAPVAGRARATGLASLMTNNLEAYRDYSTGLKLAEAVRYDEAVDRFKKAVALDPNFAMAQARIGYTLAFPAQKLAEARPYLEKAFARSSNLTTSDRLHIAAWYAIAMSDPPEAIRRYRELMAADPSETETYSRLGRLLRGEEQREEAIEVLKQGLTWDPNAVSILNTLGCIYSQLGRHDEAIATEQKYVMLASDDPNAHDSLGLAYHWAGRDDEAEREYLRAVEIKPDFEIATRHLGVLYFHTGRYRAALRQFDRAFKTGLDEWNARYFRGTVLAQLGDWDRARLDTGPQWVQVPQALIWLHDGDLARVSGVAASMSEAAGISRGEREAHRRAGGYFKGQIALRENHPEEAIADFKEALHHWPHWSDPLWFEDCLADAYLQLGRLDEAISEYQRALLLYPGMGLPRFHLAEAYRRKGDRARAAAEYRKFLELWSRADPGIPEVIAARTQLAN
jgi:tetratricopeptide (TPR) repeat protein/DNA-binding winged helix-turn-helix (wHTH) protein